MEGIINIYGVIGEMPNEKGEIIKPCVTFLDVARQVESQKEATSFTAVINSPGGYVEDGDEMYDYLAAVQKSGKPVTTIAEGECASMATKLFLVGDRRIIRPGTEFMIHNPSGSAPQGDADYVEAYSKALRAMESDMINFYHKRTGTSKEALKALMKKETTLTPEQAVEFGFATEIAEKVELKAVAFSKKFNPNSVKMSKEKMTKEEVDTKLDTILNGISAFFSKETKPTSLKMVLDGTGEKEIEFPDLEPNDTPSVEDTATIDGAPAEGEVVMKSGETYVFEGGVLKEIRPAEDESEDMEALKKERDDLQEKLEAQNKKNEDAQKEVTALKAKLSENETGFKAIQKEITALKKDLGSSFNHDPKKKNFKEGGNKKRSI